MSMMALTPTRDDLVHAATVKMRLQRGETVARPDLERAARTKMAIKAPAPAWQPRGGGFMDEVPATNDWQTPSAQTAADIANAAPAVAAPRPFGFQSPNAGIFGRAAETVQDLRDPQFGILRAPEPGPLPFIENFGRAVLQGAGTAYDQGMGVARVVGEGLDAVNLTSAGQTVREFGQLGHEVARTQQGMYPTDPNRPIASAIGGSIAPLAAAVAAGPAAPEVMAAQGVGSGYNRTLDATGDRDKALTAAGLEGALNRVIAPAQLMAVKGVMPVAADFIANRVNSAITKYAAGAGADLSLGAMVNVAQAAAVDAIDVGTGANPDAFKDFDQQALVSTVVGAVLSVRGAMRAGAQAAGTEGSRRTAARAAGWQQAQWQNPPEARGGAGEAPATVIPAQSPDQPPARAAAGPGDPFAAAEALRARLAGVRGDEPTSSTTTVQPGDRVQWTSQGVAQFREPRVVQEIQSGPDGRLYAKIEGSGTFIPADELSTLDPNDQAPAAAPAEKPRVKQPWELTADEQARADKLKERAMRGEADLPDDQAFRDDLQNRLEALVNATPQQAAKMSDKDWQRWRGAKRNGTPDQAMDLAAAALLRGDEIALAGIKNDIADKLLGEPNADATPAEREAFQKNQDDWNATLDAIEYAEKQHKKLTAAPPAPTDQTNPAAQEPSNGQYQEGRQEGRQGLLSPPRFDRQTGRAPTETRPTSPADLGSSRLQIPLSVVPPEVRRADATNRAGVRDATNRILNPPQRDYTTEGSLTPGEVMPREEPPPPGPRRSFLRAKEEPRRSFLRPREQAAPQAPEPPAGDRGKQNPNLPAWLEEDMVAQGKNPRRLLNDFDAERPQAKAQLANDKLTKFYDETGNTTMADRMRRGDLSAEEYRQGMAEMKAAAGRVGPPPEEVANPKGMPKGESVPRGTPEKQPWEVPAKQYGNFPRATTEVDGRTVRSKVDNLSSIAATLGGDYEEMPGIRAVPMSAFTLDEAPLSTDARTVALADKIRASGEITPLIVAMDSKGPYILEGGHRYDALKILGAKAFPAVVVVEGDAHTNAVRKALAEGKPVPPEVLADYPDLKPKAKAEPGAERARAETEIRDSFGDQATAVMPVMDAYARSWASATGKSADDFFGRFTFTKGGEAEPGSLKQDDGGAGGGKWYYSQAQRAVETFKDPKARMTGPQWHQWLKNQPGVKPEELEWIGLDQHPEKMTREEAAARIGENGVQVTEKVLGDRTDGWNKAKAEAKAQGVDETEFKKAWGAYRNWNHENHDFPWGEYSAPLRDIITEFSGQTPTLTKFENYQTPGGKHYRELLLTLPKKRGKADTTGWRAEPHISQRTGITEYWVYDAAGDAVDKIVATAPEYAIDEAARKLHHDNNTYSSQHFDEPNILAHVRFNERTDADGKRVLFVEEIQSDWHQAGKKKGYNVTQEGRLPAGWRLERLSAEDAAYMGVKPNDWVLIDADGQDVTTVPGNLDEGAATRAAIDSAGDADVNLAELGGQNSGKVPDAPFKTTWPTLALKRMMRWAAENGFDRIAWTTGEQQADRYDLSKQVDSVRVLPHADGSFEVEARRGGRPIIEKATDDAAGLEELIGKDLARKVLEDAKNKPAGQDTPERLASWAKVVEAARGVADAELSVEGRNVFRIVPKGELFDVVRDTAKGPFRLSTHDTREEAEFTIASYIVGFHGWDKKHDLDPRASAARKNFGKVYEREWETRENRGEAPPGTKYAKDADYTKSWHTYSGLDLKIGGEGMKGFYDQILPAEANRLGKKFGARVGTTEIRTHKAHNDPSLNMPRRIIDLGPGDHEQDAARFVVEVQDHGGDGWNQEDGFETHAEAQAYIDRLEKDFKHRQKVHSIDVTPAMRESVMAGQPLFQAEGGKPRGSYKLMQDGRVVIRALTDPNASTLPHEVAHSFLDFLGEIDKGLYRRAMDAVGGGDAPTTDQHETWARAFEAYLRSGKAPSSVLRETFERFKAWLSDIYRSIAGSPLAKKMNPQLRRVFDEMLTRGDAAPEPAPKRSSAASPAPREPWTKTDLEARIRREYDRSPYKAAMDSEDLIQEQRSTQGADGRFSFKGPIPTDVKEALEGRPDLLKRLSSSTGKSTSLAEDQLAEMGIDKWVRLLEGEGRRQLRDQIRTLQSDDSNPQGQMLADLYAARAGSGGGRGTPKETIKPDDVAAQGTRWTIDGRETAIGKKGSDLYVNIKGVGSYPLVAFDELPADKGSLKRAGILDRAEAKLGEMADQAKARLKGGPSIRRGRNTGSQIITQKLVDLATYVALKAAQTSAKATKVTIETARAALDRFTGHGKYTDEELARVVRMGTTLVRRSKNKYGYVEPGRMEANIARAYQAAEKARRRAAKPSRLQGALNLAAGVGRAEGGTQAAVDMAVARERQSADVRVGMAERAGANKAKKLRVELSEQGRKAKAEMAQERRQARENLATELEAFRNRALKATYQAAQRAGVAGSRETEKEIAAVRKEAATIVRKNLPRGERGRRTIIRALETARDTKDINRLITEVQHRAVSERAGAAFKDVRRQLKGKKLSGLPEKAKDIPGVQDGTNVRSEVRMLLEEAKTHITTARNQKAEPVRVARLLRRRAPALLVFKDKTSSKDAREAALKVLREVKEKLKDERPDLTPKVAAAQRLAEIARKVRETLHAVKHADDVYLANERKSARYERTTAIARMNQAPEIGTSRYEVTPGKSEGQKTKWLYRPALASATPETLGQWIDNALGNPADAQHAGRLLFSEPLRAAARVAEEKVARLAQLDALAKKHGFESFEEVRAKVSGTQGGGLQEMVKVQVPGWRDTTITMGEALKIFGDDQDAQTRALSDDGMGQQLERTGSNVTTLDAPVRQAIINAIPRNFRDFYAEMKVLKERSLGGRALEIRRKIKGTAPDMVPNREPRRRKVNSDYVSDFFDAKTQSGSLLERSFMKDRNNTTGPINLIGDGLQMHLDDWDGQLHIIHHAELAQAMAKVLQHNDFIDALKARGGKAAVEHLNATIERILGTRKTGEDTAVDKAAMILRKNVGAGLTAVSPQTFVRQFSVMPLLAAMHPEDAAGAARGMTRKGLRERAMASNGLIAQRMHMADAARAASAGMSNPLVDGANSRLKLRAAGGNFRNAGRQLLRGQLTNAAGNTLRGLGNVRDATFNAIRANGWADEQGVKFAFLIAEQQIDREHPNLNAADRERLIGERTAEMVYRYMNTYDVLGQSMIRAGMDESAVGLMNMFSNDQTKQQNMLLRAAASGDKGLMARTTAALALSEAWSQLAPKVLMGIGATIWAKVSGSSQTEEERRKKFLEQLGWSGAQGLAGKVPIPFLPDAIVDAAKAIATGRGDVNVSSPATSMVVQAINNAVRGAGAALDLLRYKPDPEKSAAANYKARERIAQQLQDRMQNVARGGGVLAGVGIMPLVNFIRSMAPESEVYGKAANLDAAGRTKEAAALLAEELRGMIKAGSNRGEAIRSVRESLTARLSKDAKTAEAKARAKAAAARLAREAITAVGE